MPLKTGTFTIPQRKGSNEKMWAIYEDGLCFGFVRKFDDTKTEKHPYQAFVYTDQDGSTELVGTHWYTKQKGHILGSCDHGFDSAVGKVLRHKKVGRDI